MKLPKIFKWRVRVVQQAYDLGWKHGHEAGKIDRHNEILGLLVDNIETINWLKEESLEVRDIIPMVRNHKVDEGTVW
jgi:hypothetical protein